MLKVYLYPNIQIDNTRSMNPYMNHLSEALSSSNHVVNRGFPTGNGIFDILKYLNKSDVVYFNWIEDLPDKRGGMVQSIFFIILMGYLKLFGKKVVWTLHNKRSHSTKHNRVKELILNILKKRSDLVVTHASEGLRYIPEKTPKIYIPHPVNSGYKGGPEKRTKIYDLIIWGTVTKYKGIDTFLSYLIAKKLLHKYNILIAGKVVDSDLTAVLGKINTDYHNVTLLDRFVEEKELYGLIESSKLVLFSYHSESILSSGALMDSLRYNSTVLGPDVGAFADLSKENLLYTFKNYDDLIVVLDDLLNNYNSRTIDVKRIEEFIQRNSWEVFSDRITQLLQQP